MSLGVDGEGEEVALIKGGKNLERKSLNNVINKIDRNAVCKISK